MIDAEAWRKALKALSGQQVTAVLAVQCAFDWLLPEQAQLRNEIDDAITELALSRPTVPIDRIILHSVPATRDIAPGQLARLNEATPTGSTACRSSVTSCPRPPGPGSTG